MFRSKKQIIGKTLHVAWYPCQPVLAVARHSSAVLKCRRAHVDRLVWFHCASRYDIVPLNIDQLIHEPNNELMNQLMKQQLVSRNHDLTNIH